MDNTFSSFYLAREHKKLTLKKALKAYIQYKDFRVDLLSAKKDFVDISEFLNELSTYQVGKTFKKPLVLHLFFELGYLCNQQLELVPDTTPLAIFIEYDEFVTEDIFSFELDENFSLSPLSLFEQEKYNKNFLKIQEHLRNGDCYQVNYTLPFYLRANQEIEPKLFIDLVMSQSEKVGAFAHGTYIDSLGKLFLSNSPECLFKIDKDGSNPKISTMPIKGTLKLKESENKHEVWRKLISSKKNESELNMITDLMRNDLSKLTGHKSVVVKSKKPLFVPGLVHQYSVIESEISKDKSLKDIILNLFPGGSITGAPKKRVMEIIKNLEENPRGFYCGSTILGFKSHLSASINIRSSEIDYIQNEIFYGAGGGITIKSDAQDEYDEALLKLKSFLLTFV